MILTVTPNPSLDLLFTADRLVWDDANRVPMPRRRPGGQGINLVRAARALDPEAPAVAVAPLGGPVGDELERALAEEGTPLRRVAIAGETRVFVGVREREAGRALLLNPRGPDVGAEVEGRLMEAVVRELDRDDEGSPRWVACCGSLLPSLPADFYARVGTTARERGWSFVPDCDGETLRLAAAAGADLLVPNLHEAERLLGCTIAGLREAGEAARALVELGAAMGVVTLGDAGAVAATDDGCWTARFHPTRELEAEMRIGSAVGAGDAFLAALLLALRRGMEPAAALTDAVAAGAGTLLSRGAELVGSGEVARVATHVRVEPLPG